MKKSIGTAGLAVALSALIAPAAFALPPGGGDPPLHCPPGFHLEDDICVRNPPPPPSNSPVVTMSLARQTTNQSAIRVVGRATDADSPSAALTVRIAVDGVLKATVTANQPDPPVATPGFAKAATVPPVTAPGHTFDTTVSAPAGAQQVCVTAVNVGSTGSDSTLCKSVDRVLEFQVSRLDYDLAHAVITGESAEVLDRVDTTNNSNVQQSTTISGSKSVANTHGWTLTTGLKVTASGSVGLPLVAEGKISVEASVSLAINSSETTTNTFSWSQPIIVPPHSRVVATVAVTKTTITVPFSLVGNYVYASGAQVAGSLGGTFSGVNGHDLQSEINQFDPNGMPAAKPVPQPQLRVM